MLSFKKTTFFTLFKFLKTSLNGNLVFLKKMHLNDPKNGHVTVKNGLVWFKLVKHVIGDIKPGGKISLMKSDENWKSLRQLRVWKWGEKNLAVI